MFKCTLGHANGQPFTLIIKGCPRGGLPAIDFRRAHGLSDAPSNRIELPSLEFVDEDFVRERDGRADAEADLKSDSLGGRQWLYGVNARGVVNRNQHAHYIIGGLSGYHAHAPAERIVAYLREPCPETAKELWRSVWDMEFVSMAEACHEAYDLSTDAGRQRAVADGFLTEDQLADACAVLDMAQETPSTRTPAKRCR